MTIHWKADEQYFTVVVNVFQFVPVFNFRKFINFGVATVLTGTRRNENLSIAFHFFIVFPAGKGTMKECKSCSPILIIGLVPVYSFP